MFYLLWLTWIWLNPHVILMLLSIQNGDMPLTHNLMPCWRMIHGNWFHHLLLEILLVASGCFASNEWSMAPLKDTKPACSKGFSPTASGWFWQNFQPHDWSSQLRYAQCSLLQSLVIGLYVKLMFIMHYYMGYYLRKSTWLDPNDSFILSIPSISANYRKLYMGLNKFHGSGFLA